MLAARPMSIRRLADAAHLARVSFVRAVGDVVCRRVRHAQSKGVPFCFGYRELLLGCAQFFLDRVQLRLLLWRRLSFHLQASAELVDLRHERAPALVGL